MDFIKQSIEEIALEGLDGITISTLWLRLENRNDFIIKLDDKSKAFLWNCLVLQKSLQFYELPKPRPAVTLFNRYEYVDPETGIVTEPDNLTEDPYPINIIKNKVEKGSCETYDVRTLITDDLRSRETFQCLVTLNEAVDRWGENLVIVASQTLRTLALLGPEIGLTLTFELSDIQYCILERVGRSRYMGEATLGARSLAQLGESPKSMFYHRKILLKHNLITKQNFFQRSPNGQSTNGKILHLKHFYVEIPSKTFILLENVCNILSQKKDNMDALTSLKSELGLKDKTFKKFYQLFSNYLKVTAVRYRDWRPEATEKEYKSKNGNEKIVRIIKMIQPFNQLDFKDDDDDDKTVHSGICNINRIIVNESLFRQTLMEIEKKGPEGASQNDIGQILGLSKLEARLLTKNLEKKKYVRSIMKDEGRQRTNRFVAVTLEKNSKLHNQFEAERKKILELAKEKLLTRPTMKYGNEASCPGNVGLEMDESNSNLDISWGDDQNLPLDSLNSIQKNNPLQQLPGVTPDFSLSSGYTTYRILKRACLIIEAVREAKIIDRIFTLQKLIVMEEAKEGYTKKIDKKSMFRLIQKLVEDGQLKVLRFKLKLGDESKKLFFICDPGLQTSDQLVLSAIEQAKLKHFAVTKEVLKKKNEVKRKEDKGNTKETLRSLKKSVKYIRPETNMEYMPIMGRVYGLEAKMPRLKIIHKILFYLVYTWKNNELDGNEEVITKEIISSQNPRIYHENKSWKMFIPPLPVHADFGPGWCLISDFLLRLPLSVFCRSINVTYKIAGLTEYIEDPIKQHYLIQHLPSNLRQSLLYARKYIYSMYDVITRLCYMGLVSFGPQQHKEKDQVFIYIHKNASILDTTVSEPHYYLTSENMVYKEQKYNFQSETDVDQYWFDLENICLNTPLGYLHAKPTSIVLNKFPNITSLVGFATQKTPDKIEDNGNIPGDHRGAAGLDSTFFGHLKRNWFMTSFPLNKLNQKLKKDPETLKKNDGSCQTEQQSAGINSNLSLDKKKRLPRLLKNTRVALYEPTTSIQAGGNDSTPSLPEVVKVTMEKVRKGIKRKNRKQDVQKPKKKEKRASSTYVRTVKSRPKKIPKAYTDEKDQMVISSLTKERVTWSAQEDSFLLLCKVACSVLDNHHKSIIVPWTVIRDIVHENVKDSKDKTSKACQRRVSYVLKNPQTSLNVSAFVGEAMQDKTLVQKYCSKKFKCLDDKEKGQVLHSLVNELKIKFGNPVNSDPQRFPASIEELDEKYCIVFSGLQKEITLYPDVKNIVDIHCSVLHNVILSSLHNPDKSGFSYQLFKLFKQYPDNMLRSVLMQMRKHKLISQHKGLFNKKTRVLPFSPIQFHLSCTYQQAFLSRYQCEIFPESFAFLQLLKNEENGSSLYNCNRGSQCATIVTLMALNLLSFNITLPEEIIKVKQHNSSSVRRGLVLDPKVFNSSFSDETTAISENALQLEKSVVEDSNEIQQSSFVSVNDNSPSRLTTNVVENKEKCVESESLPWESRNASRLALFILRQQSMAKPHPRYLKVYDRIAINSSLVVANLNNDRNVDSEVLIPKNVLHDTFQKAQLKQPLTTISLTDCEKKFNGEECFNIHERQNLMTLYQYINQQKELGIVFVKLKNHFKELPVMDYLTVLLKHQVVLQVGVSIIRYVSQEYAQPWLIHSFKVPRDKAFLLHNSDELKNYKNSINLTEDPIKDKPAEIDMEIEVQKVNSQKIIHIDLTKESLENQAVQENMEVEAVQDLESLCSGKNSQLGDETTDRPETIISNTVVTNLEVLEINKDEIASTSQGNINESTDTEKSKKDKELEDRPLKRIRRKKVPFQEFKKFDIESILEPVNLVPRPWRKPDGTLNKHVLQNQINGVLMFIMMKPGITQKDIYKHFNPILQPVVLFELLEMLHVIRCITISYVKLPPKVTLFSPISVLQKDSSQDDITITEACYEPSIDCIIKIGHMFSSLRS